MKDRKGRIGTQGRMFDPRPSRTGVSSAERVAVEGCLRRCTDRARVRSPRGTVSQLALEFPLSLPRHIISFSSMVLWCKEEGSKSVEEGELEGTKEGFLYLSDDWWECSKNVGENARESCINSAGPFEPRR